jgi:hypothetical protein
MFLPSGISRGSFNTISFPIPIHPFEVLIASTSSASVSTIIDGGLNHPLTLEIRRREVKNSVSIQSKEINIRIFLLKRQPKADLKLIFTFINRLFDLTYHLMLSYTIFMYPIDFV